MTIYRSSSSKVFLRKGVLKICSEFTGEHPCRSAISIKLQSNFIEIALQHGCSPVNLLRIFRTPFAKNNSGRLPLSLLKGSEIKQLPVIKDGKKINNIFTRSVYLEPCQTSIMKL